ncbi:MAG: hypothetical protein M3O74_06815 [Pseudomonadota bacterium]|nr:hypothetical protein [Pseudomonadota bacterium]
MNALDLWYECRRRSVTLSVDSAGKLAYDGKPHVVQQLLPQMKANRDALLACVAALDGTLSADGPYLPWGPFLNPERLKQWQCDLFEVVDELAKLERWSDDHYDVVIEAIERQPISTLRPDLAYFRERLDKARAEAATGKGARC